MAGPPFFTGHVPEPLRRSSRFPTLRCKVPRPRRSADADFLYGIEWRLPALARFCLLPVPACPRLLPFRLSVPACSCLRLSPVSDCICACPCLLTLAPLPACSCLRLPLVSDCICACPCLLTPAPLPACSCLRLSSVSDYTSACSCLLPLRLSVPAFCLLPVSDCTCACPCLLTLAPADCATATCSHMLPLRRANQCSYGRRYVPCVRHRAVFCIVWVWRGRPVRTRPLSAHASF